MKSHPITNDNQESVKQKLRDKMLAVQISSMGYGAKIIA